MKFFQIFKLYPIDFIGSLNKFNVIGFERFYKKLSLNKSQLYIFKRNFCGTNFIFNNYQSKSVFLERNSLYINKDINLYVNDNANFYRNLHFFSLSQFIFWSYLSYISYTTMKDASVPIEALDKARESLDTPNPYFIPIWRQLNLGKYKNILSSICGFIGFMAIVVSSLYTKNCVRSLSLRKGGDKVTFEFFSFLGQGTKRTVPLSNISARNSRQNAKSYIVLKVKERMLFLILDMRGTFHNKDLFDQTVGLRRDWSK